MSAQSRSRKRECICACRVHIMFHLIKIWIIETYYQLRQITIIRWNQVISDVKRHIRNWLHIQMPLHSIETRDVILKICHGMHSGWVFTVFYVVITLFSILDWPLFPNLGVELEAGPLVFNIKITFIGIGIPIIKISLSWESLIFQKMIFILTSRLLYIDPCTQKKTNQSSYRRPKSQTER